MSRQPKPPPSFPALVQAFFAEHLTQQRALSPQTIAAYRDAFMLFLGFAEAHLGRSPTTITLADITPELILAFLDHLERERHNSVRSRNARLAALRSFLKFAAHRDVSALAGDRARAGRSGKALRAPDARLSVPRGDAGGHRRRRTKHGSASGIMCCCCCSTTPGRGCPRSSACGSAMWCSTRAPPAFICTARDASSAACRCGARPSGQSEPGLD